MGWKACLVCGEMMFPANLRRDNPQTTGRVRHGGGGFCVSCSGLTGGVAGYVGMTDGRKAPVKSRVTAADRRALKELSTGLEANEFAHQYGVHLDVPIHGPQRWAPLSEEGQVVCILASRGLLNELGPVLGLV